MRLPILQNKFYKSNFNELNKQLEQAFEKGPGSTPFDKKNKNLLGAIIPSFNLDNSGECAAWAYKEIGETEIPFTYIILGTNRYSISDKALLSLKDFSTPFGTIRTERNLANRLNKESFIVNEESHENESSIEIQLPFLQYINKKNLDKLRILPILISTLDYKKIKQIALELSKIENAIFIVSSNLIHYGPSYHYVPFKYNKERDLENLKNKILNTLINLETEKFLEITERNPPIALFLETLKMKDVIKGRVLCHHRISQKEDSIDFASIVYDET